MAAAASWVMYFCVNCKNLLMKTNGLRVLWKFCKTKDAKNFYLKLKHVVMSSYISILNPVVNIWQREPPTWRTLMKDRRQSWSALWWSLWKTSGCSSSRMASTLLKKVMWFCCRNSCMFRCMRPCKRPAIIGRCLEKRGEESAVWTISYGNRKSSDSRINPEIFLQFFYLSKRTGCDTAIFLQARFASDTRLSVDFESPISASSVTRRCTRTSSWKKHTVSSCFWVVYSIIWSKQRHIFFNFFKHFFIDTWSRVPTAFLTANSRTFQWLFMLKSLKFKEPTLHTLKHMKVDCC